MKLLFTAFFSLFFVLIGNAQNSISIKIIDSKNKSPLAFVNVRFDNSKKGIFSDIDGRIIIKNNCCKNITLTYIGYKDTSITTSTLDNNKIILLHKKDYVLNEVEILAAENPAIAIIKEVLKNKKHNDPERLKSFSYTAYHKFIVTADADAIKRQMEKSIKPDSALIKMNDFLNSQHLLITESVSKRHYKSPGNNKEELIATRVSGLSNPQFTVMGSELQSFSFYDESIDVLDKHYINPINKSSLRKYFYQLEDSIFSDFDTTYIISFRPYKGTNFDGLQGQLHISSKYWALKNVIAKPANTNEEFGVSFQQKYEFIDNKYWFPTQINTDITFFNLIINGSEARGIANSYIRDLKINEPEKTRIRFNNEVMIISPQAGKPHNEEYWNTYRTQELDSLEIETYNVIDSIGKAENFDEKLWALTSLMEGKIPVGPIDILMNKLLGYNEFEGFRFGLGAKTNNKLSKYFSIGGYGAWATRDYQWKYGADIEFNLWPEKSMALDIAYTNDIFESGKQFDFNVQDFWGYDKIRSFLISEMVYHKTSSAMLKFRALPHSSWSFDANYSNVNSPTDYQFQLNDHISKGDFIISEFGLAWRFAYKEKLYRTSNQTISLGTKFPILNIHYTKAISEIQGSELNYQKLDLQLDFSYNLNFIGKQSWRITAGKTIGDAPWYKLYNGNASYMQWYMEAPNSFGTMRYNEFLSDEYVAIYFRHNFGSLLFGNKPFIPQPIFVTSAMIGNLSDTSRHKNIDFNIANKGFYESGLLLNSILRSNISNIGIGVFYRWGPYSFNNIEDNFAYKITIGYSL